MARRFQIRRDEGNNAVFLASFIVILAGLLACLLVSSAFSEATLERFLLIIAFFALIAAIPIAATRSGSSPIHFKHKPKRTWRGWLRECFHREAPPKKVKVWARKPMPEGYVPTIHGTPVFTPERNPINK